MALAAFLAFLLVAFLAAGEPAFAQSEADPSDVGRISQVIDNAFILAKDDVDWSYAEPNLIVEQGDLLQTDETGRAELQFQGQMIFRIGENTRIAVVEIGDTTVVGMDNGRAYLRIGDGLSGSKQFLLTFASGQIVAREPALARIDLAEDGSAEINVIRGSVEVESLSEGLREVAARERAVIAADGRIELTEYNLARQDEFDRWNEERDIALSTYRRPEHLAQDVVGQEDLDGYGEWVYSDRYNSYGWQPYVVETWQPYYYGHWYRSPYYGWTWIPQEPWGYVTYHYGSWNYDPYYGWVWIPGYAWRPAYAHWVWYDGYIGWAPLNYYGYPVITTYPYHITSFSTGYIDFFSFTFVFSDHFHHHDHHFFFRDHHRHRDFDHDKDRHGDRDRHKDFDRVDKDYDRLRKDYNKFRDQHPRGKDRDDRDFRHLADKDGKFAAFKPDGTVRHVKDLDKEKFDKSFRKGKSAATRTDYTEFLKENRSVARKVAELQKHQKIQTAAFSPQLPRKSALDQFQKLDFRKSVAENRKRTGRDRMTTETGAPEIRRQRDNDRNIPRLQDERIRGSERPERKSEPPETLQRKMDDTNARRSVERNDRIERFRETAAQRTGNNALRNAPGGAGNAMPSPAQQKAARALKATRQTSSSGPVKASEVRKPAQAEMQQRREAAVAAAKERLMRAREQQQIQRQDIERFNPPTQRLNERPNAGRKSVPTPAIERRDAGPQRREQAAAIQQRVVPSPPAQNQKIDNMRRPPQPNASIQQKRSVPDLPANRVRDVKRPQQPQVQMSPRQFQPAQVRPDRQMRALQAPAFTPAPAPQREIRQARPQIQREQPRAFNQQIRRNDFPAAARQKIQNQPNIQRSDAIRSHGGGRPGRSGRAGR